MLFMTVSNTTNMQMLITGICSNKYCGGCKKKIGWLKSVLGGIVRS